MLSQTGTFSKDGGLFSGPSFLAGTFAIVASGYVVVALEAALHLNFLGAALFLFSVVLSFLMLGLVSGSGGPKLIKPDTNVVIIPHFVSVTPGVVAI